MSLYGTPPEMPPPPPDQGPAGRAPAPSTCTACGAESLEAGFIEDSGEGSPGFARWIPGALERGMFGGARRMGRQRFEVVAMACQRCRHVDLYVGNPT
ncbi:hypothetical protein [Serinibacter arcticus]|nr:hypothetical protein [Serinibacter arcticus]